MSKQPAAVSDTLSLKRERLLEKLRGIECAIVAFSGGLDSTVLLKAVLLTHDPKDVVAVTGRSPTAPTGEADEARQLAQMLGATHVVVDTTEMQLPAYTANTPDRCYLCKLEILSRIEPAGRQVVPDGVLLDGSNYDDLSDYRPGMKAAAEAGVVSPLADCELTKAELREIARQWDLPIAERPASPCLSTRLAYGLEITHERIRRVDLAEQFLHDRGFPNVRVRYHPDDVARIEVPYGQIDRLMDPQLRGEIAEYLHEIGFRFVSIDLDGFKSGRMNVMLDRDG